MQRIQRLLALILLSVLLSMLSTSPIGFAQTGSWSEPLNLSHTTDISWFPDLAVDGKGHVHVVWCETERSETEAGMMERVYYAAWDGNEWSRPNDVVPVNPHIIRNALAIDRFDNLHLIIRYGQVGGLQDFLKWAPADQARSAASWSEPRRIDVNGYAYMSDLAIDSRGVMHLVLDDRGETESAICLDGCADLYYRQSEDNGQTWSYPLNLSRSPVGVSRPQIEIDTSDTIHITWDEGWDRLSGLGEPASGSYTFSTDGGKTWSPVTSVTYPDSTVAQLTVASDGHGGVMIVWRGTSREEIYYQWSTDGGHSWGAPFSIPKIFARPWTTPFDMYDMAADSAGHIHLLAVGRESQSSDALLGVYHLVWDGVRWSPPARVFATPELYPEYPKIVVHEGNQLHTVWFTREEDVWSEEVDKEVWYSHSQSSALRQAVAPLLTPTPKPATPTPTVAPTVTPYPKLELEDTGLPDGLYTESDNVLQLAMALSPVALVILIVAAIKMGWLSKLRR